MPTDDSPARPLHRPAIAVDGSHRVMTWVGPLLILLVVILGYGLGPTRLPLVHEEPCRALHGIEMVESGDWVIPTNQRVPILDRPPLQYWTLAIIHRWIHPLDPMTLRLSMAAMVLANALLIWWYARRLLSDIGAFVAAVAYPTMGHVFDLGRRVETDGQFTLLVSASLLICHYGYARGWRPWITWVAGATVAALAALAKGTQATLAFFGSAYLFLLLQRDWRYLRLASHGAGVAVFLLLIAVWQIPMSLEAGWEGTRQTWLDPGAERLRPEWLALVGHLFGFPVRVLVATFPWSVLAFGLLFPRFWKLEPGARSSVIFALLGIATIFVPVWLSVGGHPRYIMPLYPLLAIVCGAVAQRCFSPDAGIGLRRLWFHYRRTFAVMLGVATLLFLGATIAAPTSDVLELRLMAQPWPLMIAVTAWTAIAVIVLFGGRPKSGIIQASTLAILVAVLFNGPIQNTIVADTPDAGAEVLTFRRSLPADARLVSFAPLHHQFLYWFETPIPIVSEPSSPEEVPEDLDYFAISVWADETVWLAFPWRRIATVDIDPDLSPAPVVVIGRPARDGEEERGRKR
jgi:4-amino-4-deoxy-L-arabinose transferase-like glycosyltransferase